MRVEAFSKSSSSDRPASVVTASPARRLAFSSAARRKAPDARPGRGRSPRGNRASQGRLLQFREELHRAGGCAPRSSAISAASACTPRSARPWTRRRGRRHSASAPPRRAASAAPRISAVKRGSHRPRQLQGRARERHAGLRAPAHQRAGELVRGAERHARLGQRFRHVGGRGGAVVEGGPGALLVEAHPRKPQAQHPQHRQQQRSGFQQRLPIFLEVAVVPAGQALHRHHQPGEVPARRARTCRGSARTDPGSASAASSTSPWRCRRPAARTRTRRWKSR